MNEIILGIDVSKKDLSIALLHKDINKKYKISNDIQGFRKLTDWLKSQGIKKVKACMEATGSYGERWPTIFMKMLIKSILLILLVLKPLLAVSSVDIKQMK